MQQVKELDPDLGSKAIERKDLYEENMTALSTQIEHYEQKICVLENPADNFYINTQYWSSDIL